MNQFLHLQNVECLAHRRATDIESRSEHVFGEVLSELKLCIDNGTANTFGDAACQRLLALASNLSHVRILQTPYCDV